MPIEMIWENEEKTILRHVYSGDVSDDEFHMAIDENYQLQATVDHPVDVISDVREISAGKMVRLTSASRHLENKTPPNQRLVVIVGADAVLKFFLNMSSKFAPKTTQNMHVVNTLDDAYKLIREKQQHV